MKKLGYKLIMGLLINWEKNKKSMSYDLASRLKYGRGWVSNYP